MSSEEAVLPTTPMSMTDHICVGKAVFRALEKCCVDDLLLFHPSDRTHWMIHVCRHC